jgi:HD-like signal output (HDOD) protein
MLETTISDTPEQLLEKLKRALKKDGDFPASAKVVTELRRLASDPKTPSDKITELILREPSLGTRILSVVNSAYFQRVKPIMTISQAVVQLGMKAIAELCAGLILLQKFVPHARKDTPFASCLRKTILTSLLASRINPQTQKDAKQEETGYLAGAFLELGVLLLAFYFPQVYENAYKRALAKKIPVKQAIHELTGLSVVQISSEVIKALELPAFYVELLKEVENPTKIIPGQTLPILKDQTLKLGRSISAAEKVSQVISEGGSKAAVDHIIESVKKELNLPDGVLETSVAALPAMFSEHCSTLQLSLPPLPEFVSQYSADSKQKAGPFDIEYTNYVNEIQDALDAGEPTASILTSVMETVAFGLKFDRVILLLLNNTRSKLIGRMMLGSQANFNPNQCEVDLAEPQVPVIAGALRSRKCNFDGAGLFPDSTPTMAVPIGAGDRLIGVIYADRRNGTAILDKEKQVITHIAELIEKALVATSQRRAQ